MKLAIVRESAPGETRVAATPETVRELVKLGLEVAVQAGAGRAAGFDDTQYEQAGAAIAADAAVALRGSAIVLRVAPPADLSEADLLDENSVLAGMLAPAANDQFIQQLTQRRVTAFSLERMPRITRAQPMGVLSSMSTVAGYKAVLLAANELGKMLPMMMTAAGTLRPATALVIGAGVAGLQAIATARKLGAIVTGVDVRPAAQEQVKSLGARFVPMQVEHETQTAGGYAADLGEDFYKQEQDILAPHVKGSDIVITTALIPNRPAPKLITAQMVESMKLGSVIVDLAASAGGNCSLTAPDERIDHHGKIVLGPTNLPAAVPQHASVMFARNMLSFVKELLSDGQLNIDTDNPIIGQTLLTRDGQAFIDSHCRQGRRAARQQQGQGKKGKQEVAAAPHCAPPLPRVTTTRRPEVK
jgi:NAD(P) transhydrogenase subunit alpha